MRPPTRLSMQIETPAGARHRWALDEPDPANVPNGLTFSSTMPGGFDQCSCTLPRRADRDYPDLEEFSIVTVYGAGGEIAWQGRLETTPRTSGDQLSITPGAVGWQAALDDDQSARMIYVDRDLTKWTTAGTQRKLDRLTALVDLEDPTVASDQTTGFPSLVDQLTATWTRERAGEAWYDAKGLRIAKLYYGWEIGATISPGDTNWTWTAYLSSDDVASSVDSTGNLRAAGPNSGTLTATASRSWAFLLLDYATGGGTGSDTYPLFWTILAVFGDHGIAPIDTDPGVIVKDYGFHASDVVAHAVSTWVPVLATTRAGTSTIEPTSFVIPQLAFPDPTSASSIIASALQYEALDWWVDEGPTFNLASRGNHGHDWCARVGPSGLQETGPQVDRMYNAVVVNYNDVTGTARAAGPPGTDVYVIDSSLVDSDPTNPVNAAGLTRVYEYPNIGTSTPAGAIAVGQRWLAEMRAASTAGQANIVGHVQDSSGVWWPAWVIRAGDRIVFTDAHDPAPRRITRASYTDESRACQIDLDSPPQDLSQLLARYSAALTGLGV